MSVVSKISATPYLPQLLLLALALGIVYSIANTIITYRKLRHIPGPRLAAFSQLWLFNITAKGDVYLSAEHVLRKYGMYLRSRESSHLTILNRLPCTNWSQHDHS